MVPEGERLKLETQLEDVSLWYNPKPLPRAWIVHQVDVAPPVDTNSPDDLWRRTAQALARDLRQSALVEEDGSGGGTGLAAGPAVSTASERCEIVHCSPIHVEIEAELKRPGLVVLCDQFYPGWRLEVKTEGQGTRIVPILRANRVMRGARLPAGKHRLVYRYRPASFFWGAAASILGWLALGLFGVELLVTKTRRRPATN